MNKIGKVVLALAYSVVILLLVTISNDIWFLILNFVVRTAACFILMYLGLTWLFRQEIDELLGRMEVPNDN